MNDDALSRFTFAVEAGKVREFGLAVRAPIVDVPHPMFSVTSGHVQNRRDLISEIGLDLRRVLHGEHVWRHHRLLKVGDVLEGVTRLAATGEKQGRRGGAMRTATLRTTYTSDGELVLEEDMSLLETAAATGAAEKRCEGVPGPVRADLSESETPRPLGGDSEPIVLTRTDIVRFAGASGDFNPVHHDEAYARDLGLPSVFAMGMLPAGLLGSHLMRSVDPSALGEVRVRFRGRVWPDDVVAVSGHWTGPRAAVLSLRTASGQTVVSATTTIKEAA